MVKEDFPVLVLGTHNLKKKKEMALLLATEGWSLESLADYPEALEVEETGSTFAENARLKAAVQARHLGRWVVGEDSGLEVAALQGRPGIFSARYSDPGATDERNNAKLLEELAGVPLEKRHARYVCHIALSDPEGKIQSEVEGECRGRILFQQAGNHGFGYDPLFEIVEYHQTFGQLSEGVKGCVSHRARAIRAFVMKLQAMNRALFESQGKK